MNPKTMTATGNVQCIPATQRTEQAGGQFRTAQNIRVAAYGRVSTQEESQQGSYATQCSYYSDLINKNPNWTFAGMFADEGISGTSRKRRVQFNAMMEAAENGTIDYIITKSISRFARNTVDTLSCVRKLKELHPPVGVFFEKENLDSLDAKGELVLTILSAIAQEESRGISTNIRWSIERLFKQGIPIVNLDRMLGYSKGPNGEWLIDEEQAKVVRFIFEHYVDGMSATAVAKELNKLGFTTVMQNPWTTGSVLGILRNEKYVGDVEMQKTVTESFLTHKSVKNTGQAPRYYLYDHHVGIIDRITWDKTQARLDGLHNREPKGKGKEPAKRRHKSPLHNIYCGVCGAKYRRASYTMDAAGYSDSRCLASEGVPEGQFSEKYYFNYPIWRCGTKYGRRGKNGRLSDEERKANEERCPSKVLHEVAIKQSFMELLYRLKREYEERGDESGFVNEFKAALKTVYEDSLGKNGAGDVTSRRLALLNQEIEALKAQKEDALENKVAAISEETAAMYDARELGLEYEQPAESAADLYAKLAEDIQHKIEALYKEKAALEGDQEATVTMKENFDLFLECLLALPEQNRAGMKLNVNGRDIAGTAFTDANEKSFMQAQGRFRSGEPRLTAEQLSKAPDLLDFDEGIYLAFFPKAVAKGGEMRLFSNFGVTFQAGGIERNLCDFLGYRRITEDGRVECITERWQVYNAAVCYKRRAYKKKGKSA